MFKKVSAKNLFSWESLDYEIVDGISQIIGHNYSDLSSEGSGKSSIPNILCWVLYGIIPKPIRVDDVIRQGFDTARGEVELHDGTVIFRSRNPNVAGIRKPDGTTIKGRDLRDTQTLINKLIGLDFNAFCQTVYFAQNYPNKFIASSETDKVTILSDIQDLALFDKARKRAQDAYKSESDGVVEVQRKLDAKLAEISKTISNIEILKDFIAKFEEEKSLKIEKLKGELAETEEKLAKAKSELAELPTEETIASELETLEDAIGAASDRKYEARSKLEGQKTLETRLTRLKEDLTRTDRQCLSLTKKLQELQTVGDPEHCPTCKQPASAEVLEKHRAKTTKEVASLTQDLNREVQQRERLAAELENLAAEKPLDAKAVKAIEAEIEREIADLKARRAKLWAKSNLGAALVSQISNLEAAVKTSLKNLDTLTASKPIKDQERVAKLEETLLDLDAQVCEGEAALGKVKERLSRLELLKDGFKEVKQYIFQSLLAELSKKATSIAANLFEVPVNIVFLNEVEGGGVSKIKTVVTLDGVERALGLYSGGQYSRIALATDLALAEIQAARNPNEINFRIFDEPMANFSLPTKEKVVRLFEGLKGSTIIIEHDEIIKSIVHNTFAVGYRDGVSFAENMG